MTFLDAEILKADEEYSAQDRNIPTLKPNIEYHDEEMAIEAAKDERHKGTLDEMAYFKTTNKAKPLLTREQELKLTTSIADVKQKIFSYLIEHPEVRHQVYHQIENTYQMRKDRKRNHNLRQDHDRRVEYANLEDLLRMDEKGQQKFKRKYESYREINANYALSRLITNTDYTPGFQQYIITLSGKNLPKLFKNKRWLSQDLKELQQYKQDMFDHNLRLIFYTAKKNAFRAKHMSFGDLAQEGAMGLMKAIDKFDYKKGYKFSTYAMWWVKQSVTRAVAEKDSTIQLPVHMVEKINRYRKHSNELARRLGRKPKEEELAKDLQMKKSELRSIQNTVNPYPASFSMPIGQTSENTLEELLPEAEIESPEFRARFNIMFNKAMDVIKNKLTDRELMVIKMRFGLMPGLSYGDDKSLEEVGKQFGVTRERIRQIEQKAFRKVKEAFRRQGYLVPEKR